MNLLQTYRRIPSYAAVLIGLVISICVAAGAGLASAFGSDFISEMLNGSLNGLGRGVLVILIALNVTVPAFIAAFTIAINLHHPTSWRTPVFAFILSIGLIRVMGSFDIQFAPFMLSTGAVACLISCWFLHRKGKPGTNHAAQA